MMGASPCQQDVVLFAALWSAEQTMGAFREDSGEGILAASWPSITREARGGSNHSFFLIFLGACCKMTVIFVMSRILLHG